MIEIRHYHAKSVQWYVWQKERAYFFGSFYICFDFVQTLLCGERRLRKYFSVQNTVILLRFLKVLVSKTFLNKGPPKIFLHQKITHEKLHLLVSEHLEKIMAGLLNFFEQRVLLYTFYVNFSIISSFFTRNILLNKIFFTWKYFFIWNPISFGI